MKKLNGGNDMKANRMLLTWLLCLMLVISLVSCGKSPEAKTPEQGAQVQDLQEPDYEALGISDPDHAQYTAPKSCKAVCCLPNAESHTPEEAALALAKSYMNELMVPNKEASFVVTSFRNVSVDVYETTDPEIQANYYLSEGEISDHTWIVEIQVEYQYEGYISPIGIGHGDRDDMWFTSLIQGGPTGFLLTQADGEYTFYSRSGSNTLPTDGG